MQKVYLGEASGQEIVDVSGLKTVSQIRAEFGDETFEVVEIDSEKEVASVDKGKLVVKSFDGKAKAKEAKEAV